MSHDPMVLDVGAAVVAAGHGDVVDDRAGGAAALDETYRWLSEAPTLDIANKLLDCKVIRKDRHWPTAVGLKMLATQLIALAHVHAKRVRA